MPADARQVALMRRRLVPHEMVTGVRFTDSDSRASVGDGVQSGRMEGRRVERATQAVPVVQDPVLLAHDWDGVGDECCCDSELHSTRVQRLRMTQKLDIRWRKT